MYSWEIDLSTFLFLITSAPTSAFETTNTIYYLSLLEPVVCSCSPSLPTASSRYPRSSAPTLNLPSSYIQCFPGNTLPLKINMRHRRPPRPGALQTLSPLRIFTQIVLLQTLHYAAAFALILFTALAAGKPFSLDLVLSWRNLRGDTTIGWTLGLCWIICAAAGSVFLFPPSLSPFPFFFILSFPPRSIDPYNIYPQY